MNSVYIVDDNVHEINLTRQKIEKLGTSFKVVGTHTNPKTAISRIISNQPCLVISNLHMKNMGGITLMKNLKDAGADCEFVILSYEWSTETMREFFESGGLDWLQKPFDASNINILLEKLNDKLTHKMNT